MRRDVAHRGRVVAAIAEQLRRVEHLGAQLRVLVEEQAVAALLELKGPKLTEAELDRVSRIVDQAKKEGR